MRRAESETTMLRKFFRNIGPGSTGPANTGSRLPKHSADAIPPVRKGFGKLAPTTSISKPAKE